MGGGSDLKRLSGNQNLFEGSIRENMQRVFPNATNDRIIRACNLACVDAAHHIDGVKIGVLLGSLLSTIFGYTLLLIAPNK